MSSLPTRVRIAPSPTGDPHIGTTYVALFNYAYARQTGGVFVLRIEDTDQSRYNVESEGRIFSALRWLGLTWDEGPDIGGPHAPYRQSERFAIYGEYAQRLLADAHAYYCFCTPARLEELRKQQQAAKQPTKYDRRCVSLSAAEVQSNLAEGRPWVIRLRMPDGGETIVQDMARGPISFQNTLIDDQVLIKSDGFPTYHLANVVDDHLMGITLVCRAEEWISSTPKHVVLYHAFGWDLPRFIHMPLLRNADKSKISKRKNHTSLDWYREQGFLPAAMLNYLALQGWSMRDGRETFSLEEFIAAFTWDRVVVGDPIFDMKRLDDLNGQYIRMLSTDEFIESVRYWAPTPVDPEVLQAITPLIQSRMNRLSEIRPLAGFFFVRPVFDTARMDTVALDADTGNAVLRRAYDTLKSLDPWLASAVEATCRLLAEEVGISLRQLSELLHLASAGVMPFPSKVGAYTFPRPIFALPVYDRTTLTEAKLGLDRSYSLLRRAYTTLQNTEPWQTGAREGACRGLAEEEGVKMRQLAEVVRVAITGSKAGPPLFESMEVLGRGECLARMDAALRQI